MKNEAASKREFKDARALEQAVREAARKSPRDTSKAIAGFYRDRLLCRIFSERSPRFVLKGGQSQLARRIDARETRDIDLVGVTAEIEEALEDLKRLASIDLHDNIEFRFLDSKPIPVSQEYRTGLRVNFLPVLGKTKRLDPIGIDLVVDQTPPEDFELVAPASRLDIEGLVVFDYALQIVEERIADKVCAMMQLYNGLPSSRVKDLLDLVVSMTTDRVVADVLSKKIKREAILRNMGQIEEVHAPLEWKSFYALAYAKEASATGIPQELTDVASAEAAVASWLNPLLQGVAKGTIWDPEACRWVEAPNPL